MLELKFIRENPEVVRAGALKKKISFDLDALLEIDGALLELNREVDGLRSQQKSMGKKMGSATPEERAEILADQKELKTGLKALEEKQSGLQEQLDALMLLVPNVPAAEVPEGDDDGGNIELRTWGSPTSFDFEMRDHVTLAEGKGGWMSCAARAWRALGTMCF